MKMNARERVNITSTIVCSHWHNNTRSILLLFYNSNNTTNQVSTLQALTKLTICSATDTQMRDYPLLINLHSFKTGNELKFACDLQLVF